MLKGNKILECFISDQFSGDVLQIMLDVYAYLL